MAARLRRFFRRVVADPDARVIAAVTILFVAAVVAASILKGGVYKAPGADWGRDILINLHASALELLIGGLLITWLLRSRVSRRWKPALGLIFADVVDLCDDAVRLGHVGGAAGVVIRFPSLDNQPLGPTGRFSFDPRPQAPAELRVVHRWRMHEYTLIGETQEASSNSPGAQPPEDRSIAEETAKVQRLLDRLDRSISNLLPLADRLVDHDVLHGMLRLAEACRGYMQTIQLEPYAPATSGIHDWDVMLQVVVNKATDLAQILSQHGTVLTNDEYMDGVHAYMGTLLSSFNSSQEKQKNGPLAPPLSPAALEEKPTETGHHSNSPTAATAPSGTLNHPEIDR